MFVEPPEAPVERLVKNVSAYVKDHPKDPMGYYALARLNYMALSLRSRNVRVYERGPLPAVELPPSPARSAEGEDRPSDAELKSYLAKALENFAKAIELDAKNGLFHLGLASLMDAASRSGLELPAAPGTKDGTSVEAWRDAAIGEFTKAFDLAIDADRKVPSVPIRGLGSLVSYESGRKYLALVRERGAARPADPDTDKRVRDGMRALEGKPPGPVTPVVFSFEDGMTLPQLLDARRRVSFDLDGTGRGWRWPWVRPGTAILVWDPKHTGRVTSGRQLFGSVTWWVFWRDGYAALDALDDNRDGWLTGAELAGLAVWTDGNGDGISDPGEVMPVASAGIERIAVRATARDGMSPMNPRGLRLGDGRVLATWDWVVEREVRGTGE